MIIIYVLKCLAFIISRCVRGLLALLNILKRLFKSSRDYLNNCLNKLQFLFRKNSVKLKQNSSTKKKRSYLRRHLGVLYRSCKKFFQIVNGIFLKLQLTIGRLEQSFSLWIRSKVYDFAKNIYDFREENQYLDLFFLFLKGYITHGKIDFEVVKIQSVDNFIADNSSTMHKTVLVGRKNRTVCVPEFFEKTFIEMEEYNSPEISVAQLYDVDIIGASDVVMTGKVLINNVLANDYEKRIDIRYGAIRKVFNDKVIIEKQDSFETISKGISLIGAASFNYYHLMVEILSRLTFVDQIDEYREYPILVDEVVVNIPQFKEALNKINKFNHPIIVLKNGQKYHIDELILPSATVWMPINLYDRNAIRRSDFLIAEEVLQNIRSSVNLVSDGRPWRKIFISRKNTKNVRMKNEVAVRELFEQNGFEIIYTEEMTFQQQVECFGQAKCIVAASGAALTNIIFAQPGTIVGCIIPEYQRFYMYSTIAYLLDLRPIFLDATITELTAYAAMDTFIVDLDYVERYITMLNSF